MILAFTDLTTPTLCRDLCRRRWQIKGVTADWPPASRRWRVSFSQVIIRVQPGLGRLLYLLPPLGLTWLLNSKLRTIIGRRLVSKETSHLASLSLSVSLARLLFSRVEILVPSTSLRRKHERKWTINRVAVTSLHWELQASCGFCNYIFLFSFFFLHFSMNEWVIEYFVEEGQLEPLRCDWFNSQWMHLHGIPIK